MTVESFFKGMRRMFRASLFQRSSEHCLFVRDCVVIEPMTAKVFDDQTVLQVVTSFDFLGVEK